MERVVIIPHDTKWKMLCAKNIMIKRRSSNHAFERVTLDKHDWACEEIICSGLLLFEKNDEPRIYR